LRSAIFLDRDGVINHNRPDHVKCWSEFAFLPGALPALRRLAALQRPVVVVSNQACIGRGLVSQETIEEIHARMRRAITVAGGRIDGIFYCPHRPDDGCDCRKPRPGLLLQAAGRLDLDLARSYLVGDAVTDIMAARSVGCRPVLVATGRGLGQLSLLSQHGLDGCYVAEDLPGAVDWIQGLVSSETDIPGHEQVSSSTGVMPHV
jgi:D-glycero-D-manno-heptose 1,7-bisphosphate phosphatase